VATGLKVSLWSVATNDEVATLNHWDSTGGVMGRHLQVAFSPDGQALLAAGGRTVLSWGLGSTGERHVLHEHRAIVEGLAFRRDGRSLAIAHGGAGGTLTLRDASTGQVLRPPTQLPHAQWAEFSPDETMLATCNEGRLRFWCVPSLSELTKPPLVGSALHCVAFSPDGGSVAACGGEGLCVWRLTRDRPGREVGPGLALELISQVQGSGTRYLKWGGFICFSPDGKRIAWTDDLSVKLWDVEHACEIPLRGPNLLYGSQCCGFLPDGRHLAIITQSRTAEVWDVDARRRVFTLGEAGEFYKPQVALSPDGRWFAGVHTTSAVGVWDVERRRRLFVLPEEHGPIAHLTWSPDGARLAIGMKDGRVIIWDLPQIRTQLAKLGLDW
jgi:WD40 repeat protein